MSHEIDNRSYEISHHTQDIRLDVFLSSCSNDLSRSRIQALIKSGDVKVNDRSSKAGYRLRAGDRVFLTIPPPSNQLPEPETVEFGILYEDSSLIVLNKPPGIVSHPGPGHATGTLVHGLLKHCNDLSGIGGVLRPGIVHRLDKDTSGLMVVAKTDRAHAFLAKQFKEGTINKEYTALVCGRVKGDSGRIDLPIGRHPKRRKEMSVVLSGGRRALTFWEKSEEFQSGFSLLSVSIKTGRTHQIRVHFSHIGHPVVGDPVYGYGKWRIRHPLFKKGVPPIINRQMLHSSRLGFIHPDKDRNLKFEAPLPDDMERVVHILKKLDLGVGKNNRSRQRSVLG